MQAKKNRKKWIIESAKAALKMLVKKKQKTTWARLRHETPGLKMSPTPALHEFHQWLQLEVFTGPKIRCPNPCRPEKCLKSWTRTRLGSHRPNCTRSEHIAQQTAIKSITSCGVKCNTQNKKCVTLYCVPV